MSNQREPISKVDTAWLRMEQPTNLMMITGVIVFDSEVDFDRLVQTIEQRFLSFRRFRQKAVDTSRGAFWETDDDFDILSHVRRVALPGKADRDELEDLVSDLASTPLNNSRPLWQFHLVENYEGGQVLISRIHHCIADGIALIQVLLTLTDSGPDPRPSSKDPKKWKARRVKESNVFKRLIEPARDGFDFATHWGQKAIKEGQRILEDPARANYYASEATEVMKELVTSLTLSDDPATCFKGELGVRKRVAWAEPLSLADVKAVSKAFSCTVNDVLIAAVSGALHAYMKEQGGKPPADLEVRATVPVNLRPLEHAKELGNHFGLVFLPLPLGEENPLRRLYKVSDAMTELKSSKQAAVAFGLLGALGMGPSFLQKPALDMLSQKATTVLTNVPGPQQALYIAGAPMKEMMFWVPQNGNIGMGVSILSYNGQVFFGMIADRKLVPDPGDVISRFAGEFEKLLYLALMLSGESRPNPLLAEELMPKS